MGRFYVCPIIGTGVEGDPYRPAIADKVQGKWTACIDNVPRGQVNEGRPRHNWTVLWAEAVDWSLADADSNILKLGDRTADPAILSRNVPNSIKTKLVQRGVLTLAEAALVTTVRSLLRLLIKKHYSYADETRLPEGA